MNDRTQLIEAVRAALMADGLPRERARTALNSLQSLAAEATTPKQIETAVELEMAIAPMVNADDLSLVSQVEIRRIAVAWLDFERAWKVPDAWNKTMN